MNQTILSIALLLAATEAAEGSYHGKSAAYIPHSHHSHKGKQAVGY